MFRLWIHSAKQIVQVVSNGERVLTGNAMKNVSTLESDDVNKGYSIIVDHKGKIVDLGRDDEICAKYKKEQFEKTLDATGCSVIPGFVDGHTHPVWVGDRVHEFAMKLAGATYMEVHRAGGGIMFTVDRVRRASVDELYTSLKQYAMKMLRCGSTFAEMKSGYGLDAENEIKMLQVINRLIKDEEVPLGVSVTYCGAHAVPKGSTAAEATEDVISNQLPQIKALMDSGDLNVDNIDVFCEQGVFDVDQTKRILEAGVEAGLAINFHGEELHQLNSAEMGAEMKARAISHLEEISDEGITAMAKSGSVGVVLPTTAYILRLSPPPVRKMIEGGMAVALGSDFNPNAHCFSMPLVVHLACVTMHMSMNEALVAATLNAASSLGQSDRIGSLEVGKQADLLVLNSARWEHIVYQFGSHADVIREVIKDGKIVHTNQ
ncbi:hypothetical protein CAPTEDRAFT_166960 [Capitella teleta]|uniref:Probable imidazolonepropionase n=1 Tax=Capitella teleta TaxID=283909 RepID=R7UIN2_CAPTE|nr:hypothetical protein CAPTEDRAFT_166960 [Capitella teleta]|eukprot:ELU03653.1 hypothetical protein CAPTEDRAFT_166960 [Capitella teleta]